MRPTTPDPLRIAHLLEEGSGAELRQLVSDLGGGDAAEGALAAWLAERGGRDLSHRSRVFWERVLGSSAGPVHPLAEDLWPLARSGS